MTGANFMLDTGGAAFLVDCGLVQGSDFAQEINSADFVYNPTEVDVLFVTHAHADHIGRIPKLLRDGFTGTIYSTPPTKALARLMFDDALKIMEMEARRDNRETLYSQVDIEAALALWKTVEYGKELTLPDNVHATFYDAGHILGSSIIEITRGDKKIVFTGDLGNIPQPLVGTPHIPHDYNYLIMESVYGDRSHEEVAERSELLKG